MDFGVLAGVVLIAMVVLCVAGLCERAGPVLVAAVPLAHGLRPEPGGISAVAAMLAGMGLAVPWASTGTVRAVSDRIASDRGSKPLCGRTFSTAGCAALLESCSRAAQGPPHTALP